jgi:hypothetical protein
MTPNSHGVARTTTLRLEGDMAVAGINHRYGPDTDIHAPADAMAHGSS